MLESLCNKLKGKVLILGVGNPLREMMVPAHT